MNRRGFIFGLPALLQQEPYHDTVHKETWRVPAWFAQRRDLEQPLYFALLDDMHDAHEGSYDLQRRKQIRELCSKLAKMEAAE